VDIIQEETAEDVTRFRFNERWSLGVDGGERTFVWVGFEAESVAIHRGHAWCWLAIEDIMLRCTSQLEAKK
jgi:hypothetical protein